MLRELLEPELQGKDYAKVDPATLLGLLDGLSYLSLAQGVFTPSIGMLGDWSLKEKMTVRNLMVDIVDKINRDADPPLFTKSENVLADQTNPNGTKHEPAYKVIGRMRAGDIAKVYIDNSTYVLAAVRTASPAASLVLFVK